MAGMTSTEAEGLVVARRPVVDGARRLVAFELVYHPQVPEHDSYASAESAPVAVHELLKSHDVSLDDVVGDKQVVCDVGLDVLAGEAPLMLPPRRTVLQVHPEVLDEVTVDDLVAACLNRRVEGYRILLALPPGTIAVPERLRKAVHLVALQLDSCDPDLLQQQVSDLRENSIGVLLRGCHTADGLRQGLRSGAQWLQGAAVRVPVGGDAPRIAPSALAQVRLGVELLSRDLDVRRIESILRAEPALVAQVLDLASAGRSGGMRGQVRSLREALVVMGNRRVQRWAAVTILGRHGSPDTDALLVGLVRARTCELLAGQWGADRDFAFTAGLISSLGMVLGVSDEAILDRLHLDRELVAAAFRREGDLGAAISRIEAHQQSLDGGTTAPRHRDHDLPANLAEDLVPAAAAAFGWASALLGALGPRAA